MEFRHQTISFEVLRELIKFPDTDRFYLIDVRRPQELIDDGEITNTTVNIPLDQFTESLQLLEDDFQSKFGMEKPRHNSLLILTCRSGRRAAIAADEAAQLGYWNRLVYRGSMNEWKAKKGPLARKL